MMKRSRAYDLEFRDMVRKHTDGREGDADWADLAGAVDEGGPYGDTVFWEGCGQDTLRMPLALEVAGQHKVCAQSSISDC